MDLLTIYLNELEREALTTRKMLKRIPDDKYSWQPHPKSMTVARLANHIAELPSWVELILTTDELDFEKNPYEPDDITNTSDLLAFFESCLNKGRQALQNAEESSLSYEWKLRAGEQIFTTSTKSDMIRQTFSQIIHHRAQMGVYLRLLDIPIPSSYGGSSDDQSF